jgi:hypothetical protein
VRRPQIKRRRALGQVFVARVDAGNTMDGALHVIYQPIGDFPPYPEADRGEEYPVCRPGRAQKDDLGSSRW